MEDALREADDVGEARRGGPQEKDEFFTDREPRGSGDRLMEATDLTAGNNDVGGSSKIAFPSFQDRDAVMRVDQGTVLATGRRADLGANDGGSLGDHFLKRKLLERRARKGDGQ